MRTETTGIGGQIRERKENGAVVVKQSGKTYTELLRAVKTCVNINGTDSDEKHKKPRVTRS